MLAAIPALGKAPDTHVDFPIGVTKDNTPIICWLDKGSLDIFSPKKHALLVFGLDSDFPRPKEEALEPIIQKYRNSGQTLSIVLDANPDKLPYPTFPPEGGAYSKKETAAAHYLWRFIGNYGFDDVFEAKDLDGKLLNDTPLALALGKSPISRVEIQKRLRRTPIETARALSKHYGHDPTIQYIPALAQLSRLRIAELDNATEHRADVSRSLQPYAKGEKSTIGKNVSGSNLAGHLTIAELAKLEKNEAFTKLIEEAADQAIASRGETQNAPVAGHNQMSDSVFMVCPLLAAAHGLTGKQEYLDACLDHYHYIRSICLREDGIYRHSPLEEAAWGRGNGFPSLGLALTLTWLPVGTPAHKELQTALQAHIDALLPHQDITGMWHQVIDHPEVYREMTSSCMITFAIARCVNRGWLPKQKYLPPILNSWAAINRRVAEDGVLLDVCTGTGKQKDLRAYFDRTAIFGKDGRGGAMAMMAATEMAALLQNPKE
jgi:unsaturated rhamnogalacturonyl hydrolase